MKYIIITPFKSEEKYISKLIDSVINQRLLPKLWIMVNDSSSDKSTDIIREYSKEYNWIKLFDYPGSEKRSPGGNIVKVFKYGYTKVYTEEWDFIVKLDADLSFETDYFEKISKAFAEDPRLGITGGACVDSDNMKVEKTTKNHIRGATKAYRKDCYQDINGLSECLGWDGIDERDALMKGWHVTSAPNCHVIHHRTTGSAIGLLKSKYNAGISSYNMGYHPLYLILRVLYNLKNKPIILGSLMMFVGYFSSYLIGREKCVSQPLQRFIRKRQLKNVFTFRNEI